VPPDDVKNINYAGAAGLKFMKYPNIIVPATCRQRVGDDVCNERHAPVLAGAMTWSVTNNRMTERSNRYSRAVAAGESAIEKILTRVNQDFLDGGETLVVNNLNSYRSTYPTSTDSAYWANLEFNNARGQVGQTYVIGGMASNHVVLTGPTLARGYVRDLPPSPTPR
jgi:hypothetical protein